MAPVILFVFNRADHTLQTLRALKENTLSDKTELYIFADGPKEGASREQLDKIAETRKVIRNEQWCGKVTIMESDVNKGLGTSIIKGVTEIINKHGTAIILEDDIVTGKYFLEYMNAALDRYENEKNVWHITGWRDPVKHEKDSDSFFYPKMDCWGWATWADRWQYFRKEPEVLLKQFTKDMIYHFNSDGTDKIQYGMIESNANGKMNTWAVFWYATIFLRNGLCLAPGRSLVRNIGFDDSGTNCGDNKWQVITDSIDHRITEFPDKMEINRREYGKNKHFLWRKNFNLMYEIKCLFPKSFKEKIKKLIRR